MVEYGIVTWDFEQGKVAEFRLRKHIPREKFTRNL